MTDYEAEMMYTETQEQGYQQYCTSCESELLTEDEQYLTLCDFCQ